MLDPKYDLERPSLICHTTLDVMLCAYRELTCKNAGPVTSSTSPDHQGTGPGPPGPEPNITGTRGACACGPSERLWNAPGRHTREIARAAALAAILTSRAVPESKVRGAYSLAPPLRNHGIKKLRQAKVPKWLKKLPHRPRSGRIL